MSGDTLQCGHDVWFSANGAVPCRVCVGKRWAIRRCGLELCGLRVDVADINNDRTEFFEFLQSIVDDPDDRLPRLVFADWLDEQGDPRGELIRVEAELRESFTLPCARCDQTGKLQNDRLPRGWQYCPYCDGTGTRDVTVADIKGADGVNQIVSLVNRRTALRRQLGYDQPADKYTPQFTIRESDLINPELPTGPEVLEHIERMQQATQRAIEARLEIPPTIE